jgi:hypothetical protein
MWIQSLKNGLNHNKSSDLIRKSEDWTGTSIIRAREQCSFNFFYTHGRRLFYLFTRENNRTFHELVVTTMSLLHCKEISICVFPEKELRGFSPNFYIHVSVSDLYISTIGPPIFLKQNMQTDRGL